MGLINITHKFADANLMQTLREVARQINDNSDQIAALAEDLSTQEEYFFDMFDYDISNDIHGDSFFLMYDYGNDEHHRVAISHLLDMVDSPWDNDGIDVWYNIDGGVVIVGSDTPDSKITGTGFNLYTYDSDDGIHFAIQNEDVAHGYTSYMDTDTYFAIQKSNAAAGGAWIAGASDSNTHGIIIWGLTQVASSTQSTSADGCVVIAAAERNGTVGSTLEDKDNMVCFDNYTTTALIFTGDGSIINPDTGATTHWFLGDNANANMTTGITIQQRGTSDEAFAIKSTSIAHGLTTNHETDTYFSIQKYHSTDGGASIHALGEVTVGLEIKGGGDTDDATKSSAGIAPIILNATKKSGTTFGACAANANLVVIQNNGTTTHIFDADGDTWTSGTFTIGGLLTATDLSLSAPSNVYNLSHDSFADFVSNEHIDWTNASANLTTSGEITCGSINKTSGTLTFEIGGVAQLSLTNSLATFDDGIECDSVTLTDAFIRRSVDNSALTIYSSNTQNKGAKLEFWGASSGSNPGNIYLDYGDYTAAAPAGATINIRAMDNSSVTTAMICDISGHVFFPTIRSGATQAAAGAAANEIWKTASHASLPDNVLMIGV